MFLELYSASVLTIMFVTAVVVWVRDESRRRRARRARTIDTATVAGASTQRGSSQQHREAVAALRAQQARHVCAAVRR
ncbi:hypothetical protein SEA_DOGGS_41 [Gordonia phage Doggs]|nr:hypothetical protein SEA_DOGGS_41 [Gordonia phage Doggs]